ncbi:MAG: NAD regulator [Cohaesibacter sp.]|nr:NAD regulator [Cohaesibacter sp.]
MPRSSHSIEIGLNAAIIAIHDLMPVSLEIHLSCEQEPPILGLLPYGPFDPGQHRTLEAGLRAWVEQQTALNLGYVEQLYSFGDRGRAFDAAQSGPHEVSIGYLALTHRQEGVSTDLNSCETNEALAALGAQWCNWYDYFPWEDWREGRPALLDSQILPALQTWLDTADPEDAHRSLSREERLRLFFGMDGTPWDEERVLERYELLYEAGLVAEFYADRGNSQQAEASVLLGRAMQMDHRRILATAISRLRGKIKYRPIVFELMPETFTLTQLQASVEAISGRHLHKQNFRRLVEQGQLVEPTGAHSTTTGGRPAALFRFRRDVLAERPAPGLKLGGRGNGSGR